MKIKKLSQRDHYLSRCFPLFLFAQAFNTKPGVIRLWIENGLPSFTVDETTFINWEAAWSFLEAKSGDGTNLDRLWALSPKDKLPQVVEFEGEPNKLYFCTPLSQTREDLLRSRKAPKNARCKR